MGVIILPGLYREHVLPDETVLVSFLSTFVIENKDYKQCGKPFVSHFTIDLVGYIVL